MSTPEPYPYRQLNYPVNNLGQSFTQEQKLQTRANIGIPSSVNNTDKVLTVDDAAGELTWKEVEIPEVPVQDVEVDGQSVVNASGVAEITMPTIPVTDVTVNGTSVVSNTVAEVTVPTAVSDLQNDVGYITSADVPSAQTQSDWEESDSSDPSFIQNKPTPKQLVAGSNISISESQATVTISAAEQVNADWDATSGKAQILHKPDLSVYATTQAMNTALAGKQDTISDLSTIRSGAQAGATAVQPGDLATVATTGSYDDLTDKPDLSIYAESSDLATVATTGDYDDLVNKPTIPPAQVNADWDASSGVGAILNKPNLAAVATTGDYDDLSNKPSIPAAQVNSDWTESDSTSKAYIQHKPDLSIYAQSANLATVATTGDYADLSNKPSIPAAQVNSDWDAQSGVAQILNKPNLATVATSGSYNDLSNKPTIPPAVTVDQHYDALSENPQSGTAVAEAIAGTGQVPSVTSSDDNKVLMASFSGGVGSYSWEPSAAATQVNADWDATSGVAKILNKPDLSVYAESSDLAAVATSGDYNDLQNRPSIPAAQVNADWDANSGVSQILNKPNLATVATSGDYADLSNKPTIPDAQVQSNWNESDSTSKAYIQNKPDLSVYAQSANLATVATSGDYADLSNKPTIPAAQIQADWNETNTSSKAYIQNKPTIPAAVTVDQTYDASSTNPQSGTAIAQAIASIPSSTYTAGDAIDITNDEISVDYDTNTLDVVGQTVVENVTQKSASGLFLLPSSVVALLSRQDNTQVTVHIPANVLKNEDFYIEDVTDVTFRLTLYATDSSSESSVSLYSTPVEYTIDNDNALFTNQDLVFSLPASVANQWSQNLSSAVAFNICGQKYSAPATSSVLTVVGDLSTDPITFTFADASATKLAVKNPLPASTSADADKVLKVDANGVPEWSTGGGAQVQSDWTETDTSDPAYIQNKPATTGLIAGSNITLTNGANGVTIAATVPTVPPTDQVYNSSSTNPQSGTAVAGAISGKQNKLYSIDDVRVVSSLPVLPVSTTLYLIPET